MHDDPIKKYFSDHYLNPDSAIHSFGNSRKFTAFIWILNKKTGKATLIAKPGNTYHNKIVNDLVREDKENNLIPEDAYRPFLANKDNVAFFGRFGTTDITPSFSHGKVVPGKKDVGFITVWNIATHNRPDSYHGFTVGTASDFKKMLSNFLGKEPMEIKGESPSPLPINSDYIVSVGGKPQYVKEYLGGEESTEPEKIIEIDGKKVKLSTLNYLIGSLHSGQGATTEFGSWTPNQVAGFLASIDLNKYPQLQNVVDKAKEELTTKKRGTSWVDPTETPAEKEAGAQLAMLGRYEPGQDIPKRLLKYYGRDPESLAVLRKAADQAAYYRGESFNQYWKEVEKYFENLTFDNWLSLYEFCFEAYQR